MLISVSAALQAAILAAAIVVTAVLLARRRPVDERRRNCARAALMWGRIGVHGGALTLLAIPMVLTAREATLAETLQGAMLLAILYGVSIADLTALQVPLGPLFAAIVVRIGTIALTDRTLLPAMLLGLFTGAGMLALVALAYEWARGRAGLGSGDSAVLALIGAYVGWQGLVPALFLGAIAGLIGGGLMIVLARRPLSTPLPFAPCLAIGGWIVFLAQWAGWFPLAPAAG